MQRNTKIVATLGPACSDPAVLLRMLAAGVDVVRLNFSHGRASDHVENARRVRECAKSLGREVAVMADLQGPKIRIGKFADGKVRLEPGQTFILDAECEHGDATRVGLDYKELPQDVSAGAVLLLDDGLIRLNVESVDGPRIHTRVVLGGTLSNNKGINRMGGGLTAPALTSKDMDDVKTAAMIEADYLAVSFPKTKEDMYMARQLLRAAGGRALLIAKIERAEAITFLEEIIDASDGIMVARGDLAVEVGNAAVPGLQKRMIRVARERNKLTITATQMMESMIHAPVPTRAEVSDVANAVLDGTDAVMLVRGDRRREIPGRDGRSHGPDLCRGGKIGHGSARPRFSQPDVCPRRPVHRNGHAVHRVPSQGEGHRLADRHRVHGVMDVPAQLWMSDLCTDAQGRDAAQDVALPQCPAALPGAKHGPRQRAAGR